MTKFFDLNTRVLYVIKTNEGLERLAIKFHQENRSIHELQEVHEPASAASPTPQANSDELPATTPPLKRSNAMEFKRFFSRSNQAIFSLPYGEYSNNEDLVQVSNVIDC